MARKAVVAVIVGSLREGSLNRKAAHALAGLAPDTLDLRFVEICGLPHYDEDAEKAGPPAEWARFREELRANSGDSISNSKPVRLHRNKPPPEQSGLTKKATPAAPQPPLDCGQAASCQAFLSLP